MTNMDYEKYFDDKVQKNFDIKSKRISMLENYGENFQNNEYVTNPAIGRDKQIKELILILLTPDKSAVLIGKPGVGKTATVEGLAYRIQKNEVPDILKGYQVIKLNTAALLGVDPITGESKVQTLIDELKDKTKLILFIDEIHTLMGTKGEALDFANMFKPALDRGDIKVIGATTTEEYERYILRDKAFVRRFQKIEVFFEKRRIVYNVVVQLAVRNKKAPLNFFSRAFIIADDEWSYLTSQMSLVSSSSSKLWYFF